MSSMPEGAPLSEDGAWWWDGAAWQEVASADTGTTTTTHAGAHQSAHFDRAKYDWYAQHGKWWTGYAAELLELAGGDCMAIPHGYEGWEYDDGTMWGKVDSATGTLRDPLDLNSLPDETRKRMYEEDEKERERLEYSRTHDEVWYEDGTMETQEEHEKRMARERFEGITPEMPEPVELQGD